MVAHVDELNKLPVASDRPSSLRFIFDRVNVHIRGLKSVEIGSDEYSIMLMPMILSKLLDDLRLRIGREVKQEVYTED